MRLGILFGLFVAALLAIGCGGSSRDNGGTADSLVPEQFMQALRDAVLTRDMDFIGQNISSDYLQNGENREQFLAAIQSTLGSGGTIDFNILPITNKNVNPLTGKANFTGGFDLTVTQNTGSGVETRELQRSGNQYLIAENGRWRLYGNQAGPQ